jgi:D-alanyl-D-alanine carboxypeptidase/D-alanyl-D-alanine-endopeptidase (penicillin-binding protein 4)
MSDWSMTRTIMKRISTAIFLSLLLFLNAAAVPAQSNTLAQRIQAIMDRPEFKHALFGIEFYSLDKNKVVYGINADKLFTPGSTTKLLTEGTALSLLGADYRFHTRVYRTGRIDEEGALDGDLILVASGDPNLSGRIKDDGTLAFENEDHSYDGDPNTRAVPGDPLMVIRRLAQQVAAKGIKKIRGNIIVDASMFREGARELGTGVVMSPIVINDNIIDVVVTPGPSEGAPAAFTSSPTTSYVTFANKVKTGKPESEPDIRFVNNPSGPEGTQNLTITGSFPAGKSPILFKYVIPSPTRFAQTVFTEALKEKGIAIEPQPGFRDLNLLAASYVPEQMIAEHVSLPLKEEIKVTLKVSQNLHASITPLILGAVLAPKSTERTGFDLEKDFLVNAGLDPLGAQQADGAGGNAHFSPEFMVSFLTYMSKQKDFQVFHDALPILGRDGTLFDIQTQSPAAGNVHAKTGTFSVNDPLNRRLLVTGKGLAGYMKTRKGERLAFAIYINNVSVPTTGDSVKKIVGQAVGEIAAAAY